MLPVNSNQVKVSKEQIVFSEVPQESFRFSISQFIRLSSAVLLMIDLLNLKISTGVK